MDTGQKLVGESPRLSRIGHIRRTIPSRFGAGLWAGSSLGAQALGIAHSLQSHGRRRCPIFHAELRENALQVFLHGRQPNV